MTATRFVQYELILLAIEDITDRKRMAHAVDDLRGSLPAALRGRPGRDPPPRPRHAKDHRRESVHGRVAGLSPRRARGQGTLGNRPAPGRSEPSREAFRELQETGSIRYEDLPLQSKSGERREVEFVSNVYQENGHRVIQCNIRDITERKRLEEERERLFQVAEEARDRAEANEAQLAEADRRKDEFLAMLAHELRNPLAAISRAVQLLRRPGSGGGRAIGACGVIDHQVQAPHPA